VYRDISQTALVYLVENAKLKQGDETTTLIRETWRHVCQRSVREAFVISLKLRQLRAGSYVNFATSPMKSTQTIQDNPEPSLRLHLAARYQVQAAR